MAKFLYYLAIVSGVVWTIAFLADKYLLDAPSEEITRDIAQVAVCWAFAAWLRWDVEEEKRKRRRE